MQIPSLQNIQREYEQINHENSQMQKNIEALQTEFHTPGQYNHTAPAFPDDFSVRVNNTFSQIRLTHNLTFKKGIESHICPTTGWLPCDSYESALTNRIICKISPYSTIEELHQRIVAPDQENPIRFLQKQVFISLLFKMILGDFPSSIETFLDIPEEILNASRFDIQKYYATMNKETIDNSSALDLYANEQGFRRFVTKLEHTITEAFDSAPSKLFWDHISTCKEQVCKYSWTSRLEGYKHAYSLHLSGHAYPVPPVVYRPKIGEKFNSATMIAEGFSDEENDPVLESHKEHLNVEVVIFPGFKLDNTITKKSIVLCSLNSPLNPTAVSPIL